MSHNIIKVNSKTPVDGNIDISLSDLTTNSDSGVLKYDSGWKSGAIASGGLSFAVAGTPTYLDRAVSANATYSFVSNESFGSSFRPNGYSAYHWGTDLTTGDLFDGVGISSGVARDAVKFDVLNMGSPDEQYCGFRFQHGSAYIVSVQMSVREGLTEPSNFIARFYNVTQAKYFGPRLLMDNHGSTITAALDLRSASAAEIVRIQVESGNGQWEIKFSNNAANWKSTNLNCHSEQFYSFT